MCFGPHANAGPYGKPPIDKEGLTSYAFAVEDIEEARFDQRTKSFNLEATPHDYWGLKSGCLVRHHIHSRRHRCNPMDYKDIPAPIDRLDPIRVAICQDAHGNLSPIPDSFKIIDNCHDNGTV